MKVSKELFESYYVKRSISTPGYKFLNEIISYEGQIIKFEYDYTCFVSIHGLGRAWLKNGLIYEGSFNMNLPDGFGICFKEG